MAEQGPQGWPKEWARRRSLPPRSFPDRRRLASAVLCRRPGSGAAPPLRGPLCRGRRRSRCCCTGPSRRRPTRTLRPRSATRRHPRRRCPGRPLRPPPPPPTLPRRPWCSRRWWRRSLRPAPAGLRGATPKASTVPGRPTERAPAAAAQERAERAVPPAGAGPLSGGHPMCLPWHFRGCPRPRRHQLRLMPPSSGHPRLRNSRARHHRRRHGSSAWEAVLWVWTKPRTPGSTETTCPSAPLLGRDPGLLLYLPWTSRRLPCLRRQTRMPTRWPRRNSRRASCRPAAGRPGGPVGRPLRHPRGCRLGVRQEPRWIYQTFAWSTR
mmetsp:Transcript_47770/g.153872  ORF Transcript_47770/g.153872 Transcript_47770/m.153872 type:complete len:323 (-) Transcript_47770:472-1440(-)